jgi:hypothetical protein
VKLRSGEKSGKEVVGTGKTNDYGAEILVVTGVWEKERIRD